MRKNGDNHPEVRLWLKRFVGILLVLSVIVSCVLIIDLLLPYPYIALPVGILGIIGCGVWLYKLNTAKYLPQKQGYYHGNAQESPSTHIVYVKRFKKWIEKFCGIFTRSNLPYKIIDSKNDQVDTSKKQYPNNNLPNTHNKPPAKGWLFFNYDYKTVRDISMIRLKRQRILSLMRSKGITQKLKAQFVYFFRAFRMKTRRYL